MDTRAKGQSRTAATNKERGKGQREGGGWGERNPHSERRTTGERKRARRTGRGADGLEGTTERNILPQDPKPVSSKMDAFRVIRLPQDPKKANYFLSIKNENRVVKAKFPPTLFEAANEPASQLLPKEVTI